MKPYVWLYRTDGKLFIISLEELLCAESYPPFIGWILDREPKTMNDTPEIAKHILAQLTRFYVRGDKTIEECAVIAFDLAEAFQIEKFKRINKVYEEQAQGFRNEDGTPFIPGRL